jgi:ferrochelatase
LKKADRNNHCRYNKSCCNELTSKNVTCYSAQCYGTAKAIAKDLGLSQDSYEISFQSRLGKDPWLKPYTSEVIENLAKAGKKKVFVLRLYMRLEWSIQRSLNMLEESAWIWFLD